MAKESEVRALGIAAVRSRESATSIYHTIYGYHYLYFTIRIPDFLNHRTMQHLNSLRAVISHYAFYNAPLTRVS